VHFILLQITLHRINLSTYIATISDIQNHTETVKIPDSCKNIKILSLICCSLKSTLTFLALNDEHTPGIICGCESHLDETYHPAEIFPDKYNVFRKDCVEGAGGIFLCVHKNFNVAEDPLLSADVEVVWVKIITSGQKLLYLGSFIAHQIIDYTLYWNCNFHWI